MSDCATNYYLRNYARYALPPCDASHPTLPIDQTLELSLFRYPSVSDATASEHTNGLQAYYAPSQLWMHTHEVAAPDGIRYAVAGTASALDQALTDAGIPPDATVLTLEQQVVAQEAIGRVMFLPTMGFLERHARPAQSKVNVAVIDQIIAPEMVPLLGINGVVVGLGLSPTLLERVDSGESSGQSLSALLQSDEEFTPTLFIGSADMAQLNVNSQHVIAHELGHALGLPHVALEDNLMNQGGILTCRHWLSQEQIDAMGPFADVVSATQESFASLLDARANVLQHLLDRRRP